MGSGALVLVWSHPSACALQIYLTRAPPRLPRLGRRTIQYLPGPFPAPRLVRCAPDIPSRRAKPANARKSKSSRRENNSSVRVAFPIPCGGTCVGERNIRTLAKIMELALKKGSNLLRK